MTTIKIFDLHEASLIFIQWLNIFAVHQQFTMLRAKELNRSANLLFSLKAQALRSGNIYCININLKNNST